MVIRYKTFPTLFNEIDQLFTAENLLHNRIRFADKSKGIALHDTGDAVNVVVELPGVAKENVTISLNGDVLTIVAERKKPELKENEEWIRNEISYGKFEHSIPLPYQVVAEKVSATQENGLLRIVLPKAEEAKPKQIAIR